MEVWGLACGRQKYKYKTYGGCSFQVTLSLNARRMSHTHAPCIYYSRWYILLASNLTGGCNTRIAHMITFVWCELIKVALSFLFHVYSQVWCGIRGSQHGMLVTQMVCSDESSGRGERVAPYTVYRTRAHACNKNRVRKGRITRGLEPVIFNHHWHFSGWYWFRYPTEFTHISWK